MQSSCFRPRHFLSLLALCASATLAPVALAADAALAEALFLEGRRALDGKDYATAAAKFQESHRLDPAAGTVMNLATCEEHLGKLASAWQHWQEALQLLPPSDDRVPFAKGRVKKLERQLPHLTVQLASGAPEQTFVRRGEVTLGRASFGVPLPVDPGEQVLTVEAPGFAARTFAIEVGLGEHREIEVAPGEPLPDRDEVESARRTRRTWAYVAGGIGIAGAATGVVTGLLLPARRRTVDAHCEDRLCDPTGLDAAREGQTLLLANTVGWSVALLGLGTGTYLFLTSRPETPESSVASNRSVPSSRSGTPLRAVPSVNAGALPGGAWLSYSGSF
jgi:hypothetical protein